MMSKAQTEQHVSECDSPLIWQCLLLLEAGFFLPLLVKDAPLFATGLANR